jgi:Tol biopolymer transport system component
VNLAPGTRVGPYEITSKLGEGGMGVVYRARDPRLGRDVAIKVLPELMSQDAERLSRFERESKLLASLNHPNIAAVLGIEEAGGMRALVMELVEGETLGERLQRGAIGADDAVTIARQIAEALEEAHEKGIVHRDLKPQNVKLTPDGKVKVLDFGLAKAMEPDPGSASGSRVANSPTVTYTGTIAGVILGTAAYMSPEQAKGRPVDRRADIWAFGVVVFEMLTGRTLFGAETVPETLGAIFSREIPVRDLPADVPPRLRRLLERCLERDPKQRLRDIGEARIALTGPLAAEPDRGAAIVRPSRLPWVVALGAAVLAAIFGSLALRREPQSNPLVRSNVLPAKGTSLEETLALSPDGRTLLFVAYAENGSRALYRRDLVSLEATKVEGTEGAVMPFWSSDGRHVGFFADGKLKRVDAAGGAVRTLADAPTPRGGAWSEDGTIVFAGAFRSGLLAVPAGGGAVRELTKLDLARKEKSHRWPSFLPGGKHLLFLAQTAEGGAPNDTSTIESLTLASGERKVLVSANSSAQYAAGHVLFWAQGNLMARRFDPGTLAVGPEDHLVAEHVAYTQNEEAVFSAGGAGTLTYVQGADIGRSTLEWVDRSGKRLGTIAGPETFDQGFALSPDGRRVAAAVTLQGVGNSDVWIYDLAAGTSARLTFEASNEQRPAWSPDGKQVAYTSSRKNDGEIFVRAASGMGEERCLATDEVGMWLTDWPRESWLVVGASASATGFDLRRYDLAEKRATPLVATPAGERAGAVSPDGRWLAYQGDEAGRDEIYVRALDAEGGRWQISRSGGEHPRWRADGRELYYLTDPDWLVAVEVRAAPAGFETGTPKPLFRAPFLSQGLARPFEPAADGERFVVDVLAREDDHAPITLVQNWPELIRKE